VKSVPRNGITVVLALSGLLCTFVGAVAADPPGWGISFPTARPHGHVRSRAFRGKVRPRGHFRSGAFRSGAFRSRAFRSGAFRSRAFRSRAFRSRAFRSRAFRSGAFRSRAFRGKVRPHGHFRSHPFRGKVRPGKFFPVGVPITDGFYNRAPVVVTSPPARTIIINRSPPPQESRKPAERRLCPWIWTRETGKKQCLDEAFPSQGEGVILRAPMRAE